MKLTEKINNALSEGFDVYAERDGKREKFNNKPFKSIEDAKKFIKAELTSTKGLDLKGIEVVDSKTGKTAY